MRNPFRLPYTRRGQRALELGIVCGGIAIAIVTVWLHLSFKEKQKPELDRLGLLIELVR